MLFVGGDFDIKDVVDLYNAESAENLPNVICILEQGLLLNTRVQPTADGGLAMTTVNLVPEFNVTPPGGHFDRWTFVSYGNSETRAACSFAALWLLLNQHLRSCVLSDPDLQAYLRDWVTFEKGQTINP